MYNAVINMADVIQNGLKLSIILAVYDHLSHSLVKLLSYRGRMGIRESVCLFRSDHGAVK